MTPKPKRKIPDNLKHARPMPEPFGTIADQQMERDRLYFEDHPKEHSYVRQMIAGEEWPNAPFPAGTLVRVHQLQRGVRYREFLIPEGAL